MEGNLFTFRLTSRFLQIESLSGLRPFSDCASSRSYILAETVPFVWLTDWNENRQLFDWHERLSHDDRS
jgi:hypothetical protein